MSEESISTDKQWPDAAPSTTAPETMVIEKQVAVNPLLDRVHLPGSTFQIPSRGIFYTNGELDANVNMGELHVHPMSAYDEILMKTPDSLYSGDAIEKVFMRCIPQIKKPMELLQKDVDFLLLCLRHVTYGEEMDINYKHDCEDAKEQTYVLSISELIQKTKRIDPTKVGSIFTKKISNGQVIEFHPVKIKDVVKLYQDIEPGIDTAEDELDMSVFVIKSVIKSVDGVEDDKMIDEWIRAIPAGWFNELSETIAKTSDFGSDNIFVAKCKDCGEEIRLEVPVNPVSFFI
jgi:hypothetical protein